MHVKDLAEDFRKMGYTPFTVKIERPNFYRLSDGSILKICSILNGIEIDQAKLEGMSINAQSIVTAFIPKRLRKQPSNILYTQNDYVKNIDMEDMEFEVIFEDFNQYDLDEKFILSLKTTLSQVSRTKLYNIRGEPIYLTNTAPIPKITNKNKIS